MTDYWVDGDSTTVGADRPLHAGVLKNLLLGNLDRCLSQSGYRYQSIPHGSTAYAEHAAKASTEFEDLTPEWGAWACVVRRAEGGALRQLRVLLSGCTDSASTIVTVRVYALPGRRTSLSPDATDGLIGVTSYDEAAFESDSWATQEFAITLDGAARGGRDAIIPTDAPATSYEEVYLQAIASFSSYSATEYVRLRAPMVEEVP